jgi:hypothetical protein
LEEAKGKSQFGRQCKWGYNINAELGVFDVRRNNRKIMSSKKVCPSSSKIKVIDEAMGKDRNANFEMFSLYRVFVNIFVRNGPIVKLVADGDADGAQHGAIRASNSNV